MFRYDTSILVYNWPKVQLIINLPGGRVIERTVHFEKARDEFHKDVQTAIDVQLDEIFASYDPKFKKAKP